MHNPSNHSSNSRFSFLPIGIFLGFVLSITLIFFVCVYRDIEKNAESNVVSNIEHQTQNFQNIISQHLQYMEGIARYLGLQDELLSDQNLELLSTISAQNSMNQMVLIAPDGTEVYPNDGRQYAGLSDFFQDVMEGRQSLSKPVESDIDGQLYVVLATPILHDDEIVGVLGDSCVLAVLDRLLLNDIYSGAGNVLVADTAGIAISCSTDESSDFVSFDDNFFVRLVSADFSGGKTLEQIQEDFRAQNSDIASFTYQKKAYYIAYMPLGIEDWMICYIVPRSAACSSYQFITTYGIELCTALVLGMFVLLMTILYSNSRTQKELLKMGQSDSLTGMLNKQSTEEAIQQWLDSEQTNCLQAFVMMDIDHFKQINDTYGHAAGDVVLREIGRLIHQEFREGDIIGRIGGDEFCILMKNVASDTDAIAKADRLCSHIRSHSFMDSSGVSVTCSIGLSFAPLCGNTFAELYHTADLALYEAKRNGRDSYSVYREYTTQEH